MVAANRAADSAMLYFLLTLTLAIAVNTALRLVVRSIFFLVFDSRIARYRRLRYGSFVNVISEIMVYRMICIPMFSYSLV